MEVRSRPVGPKIGKCLCYGGMGSIATDNSGMKNPYRNHEKMKGEVTVKVKFRN